MKERSIPSPIHVYSDDIIYEILTWLPAKSLIRFKGLSKFWNTTMSHDSFFIKLHRNHTGARLGGENLLFHVQCGCEHKFISTDKDCINHIEEYTYFYPYDEEEARVSVADGFVCFYRDMSSTFSASLHNLSTHESIALPEDSNFRKGYGIKSFFFIGFDSSHTLCKILHKTFPFNQDLGESEFEVYTVGGAEQSWRILNSQAHDCRFCCTYGPSICINGVIYWFTCRWTGEDRSSREIIIKAFDVSNERFHFISVPQGCPVHKLSNVNGVPSMMHWPGMDSELKLWKLENYKNQIWVVESILVDIVIPRLRDWMIPLLMGSIDSGKILVVQVMNDKKQSKELFYYDLERNKSKFEEIIQPLQGRSNLADISNCYTYVENIMPLKPISN
ncbi:hypothetical protein L6164_001475 [Bauhinia variegata]|uniref:Uncharacterized protein n=1 Tax=Bauhinia variegata TaxID=167791 RepID=A0ACB9Q9M8_BAUVA|nr:hypothetical protein L6164_001475 [Bauhinia variegata]